MEPTDEAVGNEAVVADDHGETLLQNGAYDARFRGVALQGPSMAAASWRASYEECHCNIKCTKLRTKNFISFTTVLFKMPLLNCVLIKSVQLTCWSTVAAAAYCTETRYHMRDLPALWQHGEGVCG